MSASCLAWIMLIQGSAWFPRTMIRTPSTVPSMASSSLMSARAALIDVRTASDLPESPYTFCILSRAARFSSFRDMLTIPMLSRY